MKKISVFSVLLSLSLLASCAGEGSKTNLKKLADGVYQNEGWIYDMKELPSGKNVIPFYTIGTLSTNVLSNSFTNPPSSSFKVDLQDSYISSFVGYDLKGDQ